MNIPNIPKPTPNVGALASSAVACPCGSKIACQGSMSKHLKTKRHQRFVETGLPAPKDQAESNGGCMPQIQSGEWLTGSYVSHITRGIGQRSTGGTGETYLQNERIKKKRTGG